MARMGRRPKSLEWKINVLEDLTIDGAMRILHGDNEDKKFILIKELAGKVIARRVKHGGMGENGEFIIKIDRVERGADGNYLPLARFSAPSLQ
jgi:hypothetical protein